ncbi:hypothetical protein ANANG_G00164880 [Anguilla anguilla]|uniref:Uncharacterized protein n=1 Tax=Anguilla anguilla TaxID=7936 RepID=A0A9D3RV44_ANGAN|nr:hypothetical protein ANANG_G00164880 [Anguilla anguilla]
MATEGPENRTKWRKKAGDGIRVDGSLPFSFFPHLFAPPLHYCFPFFPLSSPLPPLSHHSSPISFPFIPFSPSPSLPSSCTAVQCSRRVSQEMGGAQRTRGRSLPTRSCHKGGGAACFCCSHILVASSSENLPLRIKSGGLERDGEELQERRGRRRDGRQLVLVLRQAPVLKGGADRRRQAPD